MEGADFSGYATKAGLKCSDGRVITKDAFAHQDTLRVPLVWQHGHTDPENVLGHAILEKRDDGIYCWGFFNDSVKGRASKHAVQHKDLTHLSIYANNLVEKMIDGAKQVLHGAIREVSLVIAGANPGAKIDFVAVQHSDDPNDVTELDDEAIIHTGLPLEIEDTTVEHAEDGKTAQEVYDNLDEDEKGLVHYMIEKAIEEFAAEAAKHSDTGDGAAADGTADEGATGDTGETGETGDTTDGDNKDGAGSDAGKEGEGETGESGDTSVEDNKDGSDQAGDSTATHTEGDLAHQEGTTTMTGNVFDQNGVTVDTSQRLSHDALVSITDKAKSGMGWKEAVLAHAQEYGVENIDMLFPDAKVLQTTPDFISRRMEWVASVLNGTKHSPFAKVKSIHADITEPEARAKGYIKGTRKKEEVFKLLKRTTGPATVYKKQKLDRDDMLDITDMDVVVWLKGEMRLMIEEELARAILVGDGRSSLDEDKIKDPEGAADGTGIRSILHDDDLYSIKRELAANVSPKDAVKGLVRARSKYRGSGKPTLFVSDSYLVDIMLEEDKFGRALYETEQALADKLRVKEIVTCEIFDEYPGLFAIMVSLQDYTIGTNIGGQLTSFEDFDIDFNQHKYLQETRLSGGLTKPFSAVVVTRGVGTLATAQAPSFDGTTNTITIPVVDGVSYFNAVTDEELTGDVVITGETEVEARADAGHYLAPNTTDSWTYAP